jgi:hypothetical protein
MNYDFTRCFRSVRSFNGIKRNSLLGFWSIICPLLSVWASSSVFVKAESVAFSHASSSYTFKAFRRVNITNNSGVNINVFHDLALVSPRYIASNTSYLFSSQIDIPISGIIVGQSQPVSSSTGSLSFNWNQYGVGNEGNSVGSQTVNSIPISGTVTGAPAPYVTSFYFTTVQITIGAGGSVTVFSDFAADDSPPSEMREELILALNNTTGFPQKMFWGDKLLNLEPGINQIRYDGAIDQSTGMPSVQPFGFTGVRLPSPEIGGNDQILGTLSFHPSGEGVYWAPAPVFVPPSFSPPANSPWVEIVSPATSTSGATVIQHAADGSRTITTLPLLAGSSGGSTTTSGGGAVLSNPLQAPPTQTASNTTNNSSTNNNSETNSTTINNTTIINNNGEAVSNVAEANAIQFDETLTPDPSGSPTEDLKVGIGDAKSAALSKFQNFAVLQSGAIPRADNYLISINLGRMGTINKTIDFTSLPFPQVRLCFLVMMTLAFGVAFMRRITI